MSADGKSFTFKDIDYGDPDYNVYARLTTFPRMARPRVNVDNLAQYDGSVTQGSTFDDVRIVLECAITADSVANVESTISNVVAELAKSQEGPGTLILDSHPTKAWTARLVSGIDGELGFNGERFTLEFICNEPWPSAVAETVSSPIGIIASPTTL